MRLTCAAGDGLRFGTGRVNRTALSLEGVQPVGNFLDVGLFLGLVDLHLYLLDLALNLPLVIFGSQNVAFKSSCVEISRI